ncbi:hypothetical protein L1987_03060 [Smallanthus sonchifolius]|uniref:Uncharacterized protein n=1 Tax=Smallanthus sonchifolius TaxID=185202 RepID=A0ACB9K9M6_9ASTR|nr:hypothetical protein L1987_03060 [Smallanthus sonchifolius]
MFDALRRYSGMGTLLVIKVSAESSREFGELVVDPVTKELLHYTEKPETFVSDLINCANLDTLSSFVALRLATKTHTKDFIKTPAMSLKCSALYLA